MIFKSFASMLIIGLGNPGEKFIGTRHNIGRECVTALAAQAGFPAFHFEKKWNAEASQGSIGGKKILLLLPDTFMNKSGAAVGPAQRASKTKKDHIFVVHDDTDLPLGRGKLSYGRNSAGHKGVESVMRALKTKDFWRMRMGVAMPTGRQAGGRKIPAEKIVLHTFTPNERRAVKKIITASIDALIISVTESAETAMNVYNSK